MGPTAKLGDVPQRVERVPKREDDGQEGAISGRFARKATGVSPSGFARTLRLCGKAPASPFLRVLCVLSRGRFGPLGLHGNFQNTLAVLLCVPLFFSVSLCVYKTGHLVENFHAFILV